MIRGEIRQSAEAADAKTETIAQRIAELFPKTDELLGSIGHSESELRGLIDVRLGDPSVSRRPRDLWTVLRTVCPGCAAWSDC